MEIIKNRNRDKKTFANINLLGACNANCYFCLGKDIKAELTGKNQLRTHFTEWKNFQQFLGACKNSGVTRLYMTGQTADGLQYEHLQELVDYLQHPLRGFTVGVRTNGFLAEAKLDIIRSMKDEIGYSIHSLKSEMNQKIMGTPCVPNWERLLRESGSNVRVAIVLNRYNIPEFDSLVQYISKFENVRYIQVRRISTDTRTDLLQEDIDAYEKFYDEFKSHNKQVSEFAKAQIHEVHGKQVVFWRTVETSCNSLNYFTDGTVSDEYFIVEGYLKHKRD